MNDDNDLTIEELIERSSLGTPFAKAMRRFAREDGVEEVFRRLGYRLPALRIETGADGLG